MADTIIVKQDSFRAEIVISKLPVWGILRLKTLFRIMHSSPWENEKALAELKTELPLRIKAAEEAYGTALDTYKAEYVPYVPPKRHLPADIDARRKNKALEQAVKTTKTELSAWNKIQLIFEGE